MTTEPDSSGGGFEVYDAWLPPMETGTYSINVEQTVKNTGSPSFEWNFQSGKQQFTVGALRYSLTPEDVQACSPAPDSSTPCGHLLPYISLRDPYLPWTRTIADPKWTEVPALALLVLAEGESSPTDIQTGQARELIAPASPPDGVLLPDKGAGTPPEQATCTTIDLSVQAFRRLLPADPQSTLPYLAHVRRQEPTPLNEGGMTPHWPACSEVIANRFPRTLPGGANLPDSPCRYTAHLVSLLGHEDHLTETDLASKGRTVRLLSLWSWSFTSIVDDESFTEALENMAEDSLHSLNRLRFAPSSALPSGSTSAQQQAAKEVTQRLNAGYVPISHIVATGEKTVSWYRGALGPWPPPPAPPSAHRPFSCADEALIYSSADGMFDISLASAWTIGAQLVLSHRDLCDQLFILRHAGVKTLMTFAAATLSPAAGQLYEADLTTETLTQMTEPASLRAAFDTYMRRGLGDDITNVLREGRTPHLAAGTMPPRPAPHRRALHDHAFSVLSQEHVPGTLATALRRQFSSATTPNSKTQAWHEAYATEETGASEWEWNPTAMLALVPTWYLLPHAEAVLPPDSIRFFSIDQHWLSAFADGMLTIGAHTALDHALTPTVKEVIFTSVDPAPACGVLIRSRIIRSWPLNVYDTHDANGLGIFTVGGSAKLITHRQLGPETVLLIFNETPKSLTLREPPHALEFGCDGSRWGKTLRDIYGTASGSKLTITNYLTSPTDGRHPETVNITNLIKDMPKEPKVTPATFAFQMLNPPTTLTMDFSNLGALTR
ncbi:hypothetical protein [Streptomyces sp. FIT100]|uniref:hypothetical protein n=1 Tax=Streptomyces sp. FIT100 TaxID=2837956 RepID=UPI0021C7B592|nr:hypothetical protein [Streptomyces sp. FIT100]UUN30921.1 hypothetical protein KK483_34765 [Streptomyces sp. FIT100]